MAVELSAKFRFIDEMSGALEKLGRKGNSVFSALEKASASIDVRMLKITGSIKKADAALSELSGDVSRMNTDLNRLSAVLTVGTGLLEKNSAAFDSAGENADSYENTLKNIPSESKIVTPEGSGTVKLPENTFSDSDILTALEGIRGAIPEKYSGVLNKEITVANSDRVYNSIERDSVSEKIIGNSKQSLQLFDLSGITSEISEKISEKISTLSQALKEKIQSDSSAITDRTTEVFAAVDNAQAQSADNTIRWTEVQRNTVGEFTGNVFREIRRLEQLPVYSKSSAYNIVSSFVSTINAGRTAAVSAAQSLVNSVKAVLSSVNVSYNFAQKSTALINNKLWNNAYATGTDSAKPGIALVGERGPELVSFSGGERVYTAAETKNILDVISGYKEINSSRYTNGINYYSVSSHMKDTVLNSLNGIYDTENSLKYYIGKSNAVNVLSDVLYKAYNTGNANAFYGGSYDINSKASDILYKAYNAGNAHAFYGGSSDINNKTSDVIYKAYNAGNANAFYSRSSDINNKTSDMLFKAYNAGNANAYYGGSSDINSKSSDLLYKAYNAGNANAFYGGSSDVNSKSSDLLYKAYNTGNANAFFGGSSDVNSKSSDLLYKAYNTGNANAFYNESSDLSSKASNMLFKAYNAGNANAYYNESSDLSSKASDILYKAYNAGNANAFYGGSSDVNSKTSDILYKAYNAGNANAYYNESSDVNSKTSDILYKAYNAGNANAYYNESSDLSSKTSDILYKAYNAGSANAFYGGSSDVNSKTSDILYKAYNAGSLNSYYSENQTAENVLSDKDSILYTPRKDSSSTIFVPDVRSDINKSTEAYTSDSAASRKEVNLNINGSGEIRIDSGMSKDDILSVMWQYCKPVFMNILRQEIFEEGEYSYEL